MRDTTTIDNERIAKQQELKEAENNFHIIRQEMLTLQKEIMEKELKKKDLDIALDKARHNKNVLKLEIEVLTQEFWQTKNV